MAKKTTRPGNISITDLKNLINKKAGAKIAYNLKDDNPTEVKEWIPTGSRWLDSIISRGRLTGIPVGKVTEIAGLESTGKSFLAAQIAANAQKMGMNVFYFDSESAIDPGFLTRAGCDLDQLLYIQAQSVESVLETIEEVMGSGAQRTVFIWDSLAFTPAVSDVEGDFNPQSSMAVKARILAKAMSKLVVPIANSQSALIVLNQLKTNITRFPAEAMVTPYVTPGGKAMHYAYSLRIWLTGRKAKASFILDDKGFRIGSEVKVKLEKSRFGTQGRNCAFKILWGTDNVGVQDEDSWFEAIKHVLDRAGAWYSLPMGDGTSTKFMASQWVEQLQDEDFRKRVYEIMDEEIIRKFDAREGNAEDFYDIDKE